MNRSVKPVVALCTLLAAMLPSLAAAWWHDDWDFRKTLTLDTTPQGADVKESLARVPVLVRLHTGNFGYFLDLQPRGVDLRFVAGDDKTPLRFHVEKLDPVNEMALIWVQVPALSANRKAETLYMYYGSDNAVSGEDAAGTYDPAQVLVLHYDAEGEAQRDATAYANHPVVFRAASYDGALIGRGARFDGQAFVDLPDAPGLAADPARGWTFSTWLRSEDAGDDAVVMTLGGEQGLTLALRGGAPVVEAGGAEVLSAGEGAGLSDGAWHHLALAGDAGGMSLYLDGAPVAESSVALPAARGPLRLGAAADGSRGLVAELDETGVANIRRSATWIAAQVASQGPDARLVGYGEDGQREGGEAGDSYFAVILGNVTTDGWVVIIMLAVMAAVSWLVMFSKAFILKRVEGDNREFLERFQKLGAGEEEALDKDEPADGETAADSPLLLTLFGEHERFRNSTLYRIYHIGVQEMHQRESRSVGAAAVYRLSPQAIDAIRAAMDGRLVRENQRLNSLMVLLTIAISGGPFLGLLGTVVGVMITFAAIAASGDVNVNAIAPGIAAALVATVAGLGVAIPALFGYNWLGSKIKEISADMQVFVDEFITKIAEQHSRETGV